MPIGIPGWPEFAACTASIASARMALASNAGSGAGRTTGVDTRVGTVNGAVIGEEATDQDVQSAPAALTRPRSAAAKR